MSAIEECVPLTQYNIWQDKQVGFSIMLEQWHTALQHRIWQLILNQDSAFFFFSLTLRLTEESTAFMHIF